MSIQRKPLEQLKWEDVVEFCDQQIAENSVIEYKGQLPSDIEKAVSAMANTLGGMIFIGVDEDKKTSKPLLPIGMPSARGIAEQVMSKCVVNITPLIVPEVTECVSPSGDRMVVVIRVSPSPEAPHAVSKNTRVYIRTGKQSDPEDLATIDRLEWILNRRGKREEFREWLIERASVRFNALIDGKVPGVSSDNAWRGANGILTLSVCPFYPDPEPLVRAPELHVVRRDIYVPDPFGTSDRFPFDEGVGTRTVEDGIVTHNGGRDGYRSFHTHLNMHGLYLFRQTLRWQPGRRHGVGELPQPGMRLTEIVSRILVLLQSASKFYKKIGYNGPLAIHLRLEDFSGLALVASDLNDNEYFLKHSADHRIQANVTCTTYDMVRERSQIIVDLAQRVAWAFDYDINTRQVDAFIARNFN